LSGVAYAWRQARHFHILEYRHAHERPRQLKGARQSAVADLIGTQAAELLGIELDGAGIRRNNPVSSLNSVVLPAPLGPNTPVIEPRSGPASIW
jgi:hypothetical protein